MPIDPKRILYRDDHLLVVLKLPNELTVAAGEEKGKLSLYDFLHKSEPGLRVVHRLDFGTSGVLAFARGAAVARTLREKKFQGWTKTYIALVAGPLHRKTGVIDSPLPSRTDGDLVPASTRFTVLETFPVATLVEATIDTGRKHQIRRHFASIGHPLILDPLYGNARLNVAFTREFHYHRFFLHASSLSFPHPVTGKIIHVQAPLPKAFQEVVERLRGLT